MTRATKQIELAPGVALAVAVIFTGLALNVWVQDGLKPFLIVSAASVGCLLVVGSVGWMTGSQVVKHSRQEAAAIESGNHTMKELTR
jgi:hypothetical protein